MSGHACGEPVLPMLAQARGERDGDRGDDERVRGGAVVV